MRQVRIFISSPGDLKEQRNAVSTLIAGLNSRPQLRDSYKFDAMLYERSAPPVTGDGAQAVVDEHMMRAQDADIVICMLWSRLGTPLTDINPDTGQAYGSGTEYEFYSAYRSYRRRHKPLLLLYRCTTTPPLNADPQQIAKVISFFSRFDGPKASLRGLYKDFTTTEDLQQKVTNDLETIIANWEKPVHRLVESVIRPYAPLVVLLLILLGVLVYFLSPKSQPPKIGAFNVAISQFIPGNGSSEGIGSTFTQAFYNTFVESLSANKLDQIGISVWSPEQVGKINTSGQTADLEAGARDLALALNQRYGVRPNIIVYGQIELKDGDYVVTPRFYVSDKLYEARDIYGGFTMGSVLYGSNSDETLIKSGELAKRSRALTYITQGILQLVAGDFEAAHSTLQQVIDQKLDSTHDEMIFSLMGNATLAELDAQAGQGTTATVEDRSSLLDRADSDFTNAINHNNAYARGYLGRASVLYLRYLQPAIVQGDWLLVSDSQLTDIEDAYNAAMSAKDQPATADLPEKIKFGLGQVAIVRYLRGDQAQWQTAYQTFEAITVAYEKLASQKQGDEIRLQAIAAEAYNRIGLLWEKQGDLDKAKSAYQKAVETIGDQQQYRARRDVLRRSLLALNIGRLRAEGQVDEALKVYDTLFALPMPDADTATYRFEQAKMLDEATPARPGEAVAALQKALALDLSDKPILAGQIYQFLGDLYYGELNQPEQALTAYEQALKLDPTGQVTLKKVIAKLQGVLSPTATP